MSNEFVAVLDAPDAQLIINRVQALPDGEARCRKLFYEWVGDDKRAEFINGEIVLPFPTPHVNLEAEQRLFTLLFAHVEARNLGELAYTRAMISLTRNDYEPDICFWRSEIANEFIDDLLYFPTPDFIIEGLQLETEERDRGIKFEDYAAHGVREYWLIDPRRQLIEQYVLDEAFMAFEAVGTFKLPDSITAVTVPGFTIPVRAIFDQQTNRETLLTLLNP